MQTFTVVAVDISECIVSVENKVFDLFIGGP